MKDIVSLEDEQDLGIADTQVSKAGNVIAVQIGSLDYAPTFGVDKKFFLEDSIRFQNENFAAYLVERLSFHQINVTEVTSVIEALMSTLTFYVGEPYEDVEGFIR